MPIKLPKSFPRRKASGNALEDVSSPAEPSFRVLERPASNSFDGSDTLRRMSQGRQLSVNHSRFNLESTAGNNNLNVNNRGSGGTNNSTSSGGHDNSSSSARFSSSSTLPSSADIPLDDRPAPNPKDPRTMPAPPVPESTGISSLRAAGRAFSFGRKKAENSVPPPRPVVDHAESDGPVPYTRERAHTESSYASGSTATPPKLLDTGLDFGSTDNFGSMFESFGKRRSQIELDIGTLGLGNTESPETMSPGVMKPLDKAYTGEHPNLMPSPLNIDHSHEAGASPKSWASHDSQDGLISSHSPAMERTFSYEEGQERIDYSGRLPKSRTMPLPTPPSPTHRKRQQRPPSEGLRRSSVYADRRDSARDSALMHDNDAKLVMDSIATSRRLDKNTGGYQDSDNDDNPAAALVSRSKRSPSSHVTAGAQHYAQLGNQSRLSGPTFEGDHSSTSDAWHESSTNTTPRAKKPGLAYLEERSMFDASPPLPGRRTPPSPSKVQPPARPQTNNKIMTPAQFERYRKEQEVNRAVNPQMNNDTSDDEGDDYEDDDEVERNKQLARQRRKQEAHLAVYRQQMMKVTGEQPSDLPSIQLRPSMDRSSQSAPNMQNLASVPDFSFDKPTDDGKGSDEEDEDVPLGVLAAHGFPSKNRPPSAMSAGGSRIQYKSESYPLPPASTSGASQGGRASGLPPFAKHLPQDPYYGASLVNPSNRESLTFNHTGPESAHGASQPNMPPGGLVGVIAGEERARAARRGSPNAQGNYSSPLPSGMTQMPGMPQGMPPMMTPGEQATVQMSEQMKQMMQMQMQWMQQMQQMMAQGIQFPAGQPPPTIPQQQQMMMNTMFPNQPPLLQPQRPISSEHLAAHGNPGGQQQVGPSMSMMGSGQAPVLPPHRNNRQSLAPSMMSGALGGGPGPGYTPSIAPSERSNVGMPSRYRPVSIAPADERHPRAQSRSSTFTSGTLHPPVNGRDSRLSKSGDRRSNLSLRPLSQPPPKKAGSDDDDEEGWEEMKRKREKKKSMWRISKKKEDQASGGLEYYDYSESQAPEWKDMN
ncbi:MAG: hypothetical protein Q9217_004036 [Psora testacea]